MQAKPEIDDLEALLAGLPRTELGPAREARILAALQGAAERRGRWWVCGVPLWQAAAACVAAAGLTAAAVWTSTSRARGAGYGDPSPRLEAGAGDAPVVVRLDAPVFAHRSRSTPMDVSRWRLLAYDPHGAQP